jgi:hypothetical protein
VFQTAGLGAHYLAANSPYRNVGLPVTTEQAKVLAERTTWAPVLLNQTLTANTVLGPLVERDSLLPDLGYHYAPLDYLADGLVVADGATLVLTNGVRVGVGGTAGGLKLFNGGHLDSGGTPKNLNYITRLDTVQENPANNSPVVTVSIVEDYTPTSDIRMRFTRMTMLASEAQANYHLDTFQDGSGIPAGNVRLRDCEFTGGAVQFRINNIAKTTEMGNNLFDRVHVNLIPSSGGAVAIWNNLFHGGAFHITYYTPTGTPEWVIRENAFDRTYVTFYSEFYTHCNNAYITDSNKLGTADVSAVTLNAMRYVKGPLGDYYQLNKAPNTLVGKGGRTAADAGLFHYTTAFNQEKEGDSVLDIGYHYVALDLGPEAYEDIVLVEDAFPNDEYYANRSTYTWSAANPNAYAGQMALQDDGCGENTGDDQYHYVYTTDYAWNMLIQPGDIFFAYLYRDGTEVSAEEMLQICTTEGYWYHRPYWGADILNLERTYVGPMPDVNTWGRLEVAASMLGVEGEHFSGICFTSFGGKQAWDHFGIRRLTTVDWSSAKPKDTDEDGLPDYFEDSDGSGEDNPTDLADWQNANSDGDDASVAGHLNDNKKWLLGLTPKKTSCQVSEYLNTYTPMQ